MNGKKPTDILLKLTVATILAVSCLSGASAQDYIGTPVTISKEKVRASDGKICFSHVVREKQTLYAIAKAYEVSIDDIYRYNPNLKETGVRKNAIILIPSQEALKQDAAPASEPAKETARKVQPEKKDREEVKVKPVQKKQKTHIVKWYEDLDVIAERYGVTVEAVMKANGLTGRKLAKRQKLIIPEPGTGDEPEIMETGETAAEGETADEVSVEAPDSTATIKDTARIPDWIFSRKDEVNVTLILPMRADSENVSRNNMDFYSGVLMAVHDLAEEGISTELNVYDTSDSSHPVSVEDLENSDLVIGPVSYGDLSRLIASDVDLKAVISPLDSRAESLAHANSNFIQVPTPSRVTYKDLTDWVAADTMPGDTLVLISEKGARQSEAVMQMTQAVDSSGLAFLPFSYSILEGRNVIEPLTAMMTATGTNRVMIASDSEAFVNDVVRNLNILIHNKLNIVLYAPSRIRNFETIEVENLHNTSLHVSLGYLTDYDAPETRDFLLKYRALYGTEPTQYAFQGYDIASYFISMCSRYGSNWMKKLDSVERHILQSTFRYARQKEGGFVNQGVRRLIYGKDWSVTKVK